VKPNRAMFLSYERSLQPDLVGAGIIVPIAGLVGSRDPGPSASDKHTETAFAQEADVQHRYRPDERGQVYGEETRATVARLEDVSS